MSLESHECSVELSTNIGVAMVLALARERKKIRGQEQELQPHTAAAEYLRRRRAIFPAYPASRRGTTEDKR